MRAFVVFLILFNASAANYDVFVYNNNNNYINNRSATEQVVHPFKFGYYDKTFLKIDLHLKNKPENVIVNAYLNYPTGYTNHYMKKDKIEEKQGKYFEIRHYLQSRNITIEIKLSTNSGFCVGKEIVTATRLKPGTDRNLFYDICLNSEPCVIEVDLSLSNTVCKEDTKQTPAQWNVIIYVIPAMIVVCVIALMVYISFKKYRHRISEETIEINTSVRNEVVYATLSLENGHGEPPIRHESPYAQIVGVMRPVLSRK